MGAQLKNILPGVQVRSGKRGKTIRFSCMIRGQRFAEMCDEPVEMMIDPSSGRATRLLKQAYNRWVDQCQAKAGHSNKGRLREPTIAELLKTYEEIAWERNRDPNYNRPSAGRIESVWRYYGYCVDASGLSTSRPYSDLMDVDMVRKIFRHFCSLGVKGITAWTYLSALQSVTAKWTLALYRDRGFDVRAPLIPDVGKANLSVSSSICRATRSHSSTSTWRSLTS